MTKKSFTLCLACLITAGIISLMLTGKLETEKQPELYPEEVLPRGDAL